MPSKINVKNMYEIFSIIVGASAICIILFFLGLGYDKCIIFMEPILWIRIPEIIVAIIVLPYYLKKILF